MYSAAATACIFRIGQGEKNVKESEKDVDNRRCSYGADALHSKGSCADSEMQRDQSIWSEGCGTAAVSEAGAVEMPQRSGGGVSAEV